MLSAQENEFLTRIGPGTPAGNLLRRYWHPLCPAAELTTEKPKKRVKIMGENLVVFRDPAGRYGAMAEQCPHRRASLYYGFIENDGLRCPYHGWKFRLDGQCIEQPFEPADSRLKDEICQTAYPVEKLAGLLFIYMGPQPAPLLPRWETLVRTDGARKIRVLPDHDCNWVQTMENSVDPTHTYYLHGHTLVLAGQIERARYYYRPMEKVEFEVVKTPTWAGIRKIRAFGGDDPEKETGHPLIFPNILLVPQGEHLALHWRVPIDDEHTRVFWFIFTPGAKSADPDADPQVDYSPSFKNEGEYELIKYAFASQDMMAWETQGPVVDRSLENLGTTDRGVVLYRKLLREQIERLQNGEEPAGVIRDPALNERIDITLSSGQARTVRGSQASPDRRWHETDPTELV
jgi:5,5'-dehydrodivanillate O-demethylase oxygenase subunit